MYLILEMYYFTVYILITVDSMALNCHTAPIYTGYSLSEF